MLVILSCIVKKAYSLSLNIRARVIEWVAVLFVTPLGVAQLVALGAVLVSAG